MTLSLLLFIMPILPRTTERPVRKRGDECSDLPCKGSAPKPRT